MERACWNPVLMRRNEEVFLYFKVGKSPESWKGYFTVSSDFGENWSEPKGFPAGIVGPTKNAPIGLGSAILSGSSDERFGCSVHFEMSRDGRNWRRIDPTGHGHCEGCIQPAILNLGAGKLVAYCRSSMGVLVKTVSVDNGETWSDLCPTDIPNPDSGIAAISLHERGHVLAFNRSTRCRTPLVLAVSSDGDSWTERFMLEDGEGEFSYPSLWTNGSTVGISYSVDREHIAYVELSESALY